MGPFGVTRAPLRRLIDRVIGSPGQPHGLPTVTWGRIGDAGGSTRGIQLIGRSGEDATVDG